jgi:hypothetical protein
VQAPWALGVSWEGCAGIGVMEIDEAPFFGTFTSMFSKAFAICCVIAMFILTAVPVQASDDISPLTLDVPATQRNPVLDPNRWRLEVLGTGMGDLTDRDVQMGGASVAFDYYTHTDFCLRCELTAWGVSTEAGDAAAGQGSLGFRHHFYQFGDSSLFIDVGFGIYEAGRRTPQNGTYFNFTFDTGIGVDHPIARNVDLIVGLRYFHLSNARLEGPEHNPSLNGPEGYVGVMFRL